MIDLDKIKPADLWYVIGYIATDGSLSIDGPAHKYNIKGQRASLCH